MSSRFSFKSLASVPVQKKTLAENLSENWSYKSYYQSVITKITEAIKRNDVSLELKLSTNDNDFIKSLTKDLIKDGFKTSVIKLEESKNMLLIAGWTSAREAHKVPLQVAVKQRRAEWFLHTDIWDEAIEQNKGSFKWIAGENVSGNKLDGDNTIAYLNREALDTGILICGQSGSGKTEGVKFMLTSYMKMNKSAHLYIADLKRTSDYDVFKPFTVNGNIAKNEGEINAMILDVLSELEKRILYSQTKKINSRDMVLNGEIGPVVFVIDEIAQMFHGLKYEINRDKQGTSANALFQIATKGRAVGITMLLISQFVGADFIPRDLYKSVRNRLAFRSGSAGESIAMIDTEAAFQLGKLLRDDMGDNNQTGYFYDGNRLIRALRIDDYYIYHELSDAFAHSGRTIKKDESAPKPLLPDRKKPKSPSKTEEWQMAIEFQLQYSDSIK